MHKSLLFVMAVSACFVAAACGGTTSEAEQPQQDASLQDGQADAAPETATPDVAADTIVADAAGEAAPPDSDVPDESAPDAVLPDQGAPDAVVVDSDGVHCGNTTCAPGLLCCASVSDAGASFECAASCADAGAVMECDGPEDCSGGQCCVAIIVGAGTLPSCPIDTQGATCKASCPTQIPMSCPGQGQGQLCHASNDCADPQNPTCCTFAQGGVSATFCVNALLKSFASSCN